MASASASSPAVFAPLIRLPYQQGKRPLPSLRVRSHRYEDEGRSRNDIVEANLGILMKWIEEVRMRERLETCYENDKLGWNYGKVSSSSSSSSCNKSRKKPVGQLQYNEIAGTVGRTFGLTILSGTFGLCLASFLLHLNQW